MVYLENGKTSLVSFVQIGLPSSYLTLGKEYFGMVNLENGKTSPGRLLVSRGVVSCEPL